MILTSNTEATENKVQFLNFAYTVKGFQCHSNNSLQLLELKEKNKTLCVTTTTQLKNITKKTCTVRAPTQTYLRSSLVVQVNTIAHGL